MPLSAEQRAWLDELGTLVGTPPKEDPAPRVDKDHAPIKLDSTERGGDPQALVGLPINPLDLIPDVINSKITITNESGTALRVVAGSIEKKRLATFKPAPPVEIPAQATRVFGITNKGLGPFPAPVGTGGEIKYDAVGDAKVQFFMKWERGFAFPSRDTTQTVTPDDGNFTIEGINTGGDDFTFIVSGKGGPGPKPDPGPTPGPDVQSSCLISITNQTALPLTRSEAEHERGDFMALVPDTIPPGGTITVVSVETPNSKDEGCKGFIVWEVGAPMAAVWRIEWDNPEGAKNNSSATVTPQTAGFKTTDQIGQGEENVPVSFVLSGGGAGPTPPPDPGPAPAEPPFEPPAETKQPTLRKGDKSGDGWVEYAQSLLNFQIKAGLEEDGNFGGGTESAVIKFQKEKKLQVDGVIGNQTWAALREGAPEKPSTDGRQAHTFVEHGTEARWTFESDTANRYFADSDSYAMTVSGVGDEPLDPATLATLRITPPGGKPKAITAPLGPGEKSANGEFSIHNVRVPNFRKTFPSVPVDAPITEYLVEAYLPKELGGDFYSAKILAG